ncbi:hypothetical protein [Streptomyces sp. NPDC087272]|uniref:hypothetical protein n=1 Tax=Streptomyces sp. NPDC087272 TaxID=3365775 RepID=UPI0038059F75
MTPADLTLTKETARPEPEATDPVTFADRLPGLAVAGGYIAAGLVLLLAANIAVGLLLALHGLHLATWILLSFYCLLAGAATRLSREHDRIAKALTIHWASYRVWASDDLPQHWERLTARGRTVRAWVWEDKTTDA